jgi:hypothetical protein
MKSNSKFNNQDSKDLDELPILQVHGVMDITSAMSTVKQHLAYVVHTYICSLQQGVRRTGPGHDT